MVTEIPGFLHCIEEFKLESTAVDINNLETIHLNYYTH